MVEVKNEITWSLVSAKLGQLKDLPTNPRKMTDEEEAQLVESLKKFGVAEKPIINLDGTLIGGHQRKRILRKLGIKEIDCWSPNRLLTKQEVKELNIRLNKNCAKFDYDILANEFEIEELCEWGFKLEEFEIDFNSADEIDGKEKKEKEPNLCPACGAEI